MIWNGALGSVCWCSRSRVIGGHERCILWCELHDSSVHRIRKFFWQRKQHAVDTDMSWFARQAHAGPSLTDCLCLLLTHIHIHKREKNPTEGWSALISPTVLRLTWLTVWMHPNKKLNSLNPLLERLRTTVCHCFVVSLPFLHINKFQCVHFFALILGIKQKHRR